MYGMINANTHQDVHVHAHVLVLILVVLPAYVHLELVFWAGPHPPFVHVLRLQQVAGDLQKYVYS